MEEVEKAGDERAREESSEVDCAFRTEPNVGNLPGEMVHGFSAACAFEARCRTSRKGRDIPFVSGC